MAKTAKPKKMKARTAKATAPSVTPTYLKKGQTYTMGLHNIVRVLKAIDKHGHTRKFARAAEGADVGGTFDAKTVNFVKDFMAKHKMHADPVGKHIINAQQPAAASPVRARAAAAAPRSGRFNCNFN